MASLCPARPTMPCSRRQFVGACPLAVVAPGCLEDLTDEEEPESRTIPTDEEQTPPPADIDLAHWYPDGTYAPLTAGLAEVDREITVHSTTYADRSTHEEAMAAAFVDTSPPELLQTVLGGELERYVTAVTIDDLSDIIDEDALGRLREGLPDLLTVEGTPYAVPTTISCTNGLLVNRETIAEADVALADIDDAGTLLEVARHIETRTDATGFSLLAGSAFRLFDQVLLGHTDEPTYASLGEGEIHMRTLRDVVDMTVAFGRLATWLPAHKDSTAFSDTAFALWDRRLGSLLNPDDWKLIPFPGTDGAAVLTAAGLCLAKRGRDLGAGATVLDTLEEPVIQQEIATRAGCLPAIPSRPPPDRPFLASLRDLYTEASTVLPALSTGCGLDADTRARAYQTLATTNFETVDPDELADDLAPILR